MPYVKVGEENGKAIHLFYEDHGSGTPVVLVHGFPLSGAAWEKQTAALLDEGHRVITYDRRGFGKSDQPSFGYDFDTFAADLSVLMEALDLRDGVLVGSCMGTGEVARYIGTYSSARVAKAVMLAPLPPCLGWDDDNPEGIDWSIFADMRREIRTDRFAFLKNFLEEAHNADVLGGSRIGFDALRAFFTVAAAASATATHDSVAAWTADFRDDLAKFDIPVLAVQGEDDRIMPIAVTGDRLKGHLHDLRYEVVEGGPHAIGWTHADEVNAALIDFLR
ncbi:pimeloyl-ACP methyl ester carboxylesterase [Actinocorallia herbida]|uniref:Pimeloyl-ACP methyl ester carboxylesterase n=1 Tax=Actinocorallia herbida TaxID=58109 RepID=A0A3N1CVQ0_9ACTN|nr:alpha/beta hydrolase [Actinocorallia herbida]ROO85369.1 pimeloyl-ACP methyl ester carboxylesterase [Actinocorallia herbida]